MGRFAFASWSVVMSGLLFACEMAEPPDNPSARLKQPGVDLVLGQSGEDVRAVNGYLRRYGYFPNDALARTYPEWRPIVSRGPGQADRFDDQTRAGVRALQANLGLPVTGIVDAATRSVMARARCGVPDGIQALNDRHKFNLFDSKWPTGNVTWRVLNTDEGDVTLAEVRAAAANAFATWAAQTTIAFTEVTFGTADIEIKFEPIDGPENALAQNFSPRAGGDMFIDTAETWSVASPPPATAYNLTETILHELGHGLGLRHSGFPDAIMAPATEPGLALRPLHLDDNAGISSKYDSWFEMPGGGKDIGVGADGTVWAIGLGPVIGGNFAIHKWNESSFSWQSSDGGGVRIAVAPDGVPWVLNAAGQIFRRTSSSSTSGFWQEMPGGARDIGIGGDGSVWVIGTASIPGGFEIFKFNGSGWTKSNGGAVRIAVDSLGFPWVTASDGSIFRRDSNSATSGNWELMPGGGNDIGVGPWNYPYVIGRAAIPGGFEIFIWNQQPSDPLGADERRDWVKVPGGAVAVSVGPDARPWVINSSGQIFRSLR